MKLNKILILFVVLLLCTTIVSAGFWDSITGKFNLRVVLGIDQPEEVANPQQRIDTNIDQLDRQTDGQAIGESGRDSSGRVISVLYKSQQPQAPRRVTHYVDFVGEADNFMIVNANLNQLQTSFTDMGDELKLSMEGLGEEIVSNWGIENDAFKALGQVLSTEEIAELQVFDNGVLVGDGNDDEDVELTSGLEVKNPKQWSSNEKVRIMSVPANDDSASGQYTLEFKSDCDLSDAEGFEAHSMVHCIELFTAKQDGFLLGDIQAKEVYIFIREGASEEPEETFPTCDNGLDDDGDGVVDEADSTCSRCNDLDGGINVNTDSMAQIVIPDMPTIAYTDSCHEGILREAVCFEDGSHFVDVICPEGQVCFDGACIVEPDNTVYVGFGEWQAMNGNLNQLMQRRATALATAKKLANAAGIAIPNIAADMAIPSVAKKMVDSKKLVDAKKLVEPNQLNGETQEKLGLFARLFGKK
ncbi:MAG: hypothetical protein KKA65_05490 [Nanoarchaeota archaeon]|nr:hypothetical protein [Nanoarchaeota archaeon]MBU4456924.1 hypothetical protein [Nanoarchaeota archaeon]MCG2719205.1 hypothetical protein [Nanoarchaeota archaeon]